MPFLPGLAVIFVGVAGGSDARVDKQVQTVLAAQHVVHKALPAATVKTLAHHGDGAGDIVRTLHVDGVVAAELVEHERTLRIAIYGADGSMKTLSEIPLDGPTLTKSELGGLRDTLADDVGALVAAAKSGAATVADVGTEDDVVAAVVAPPAKHTIAPKAAARRVAPAPKAPEPAVADVVEITDPADDAPAAVAVTQTADTSDSVDASDLEALSRGDADDAGGSTTVTDHAEEPAAADGLHLCATAGIGLASRSFTPGPSTVAGYSSSPVGTLHLDARVQPTARITLSVLGERALDMNTPMGTTMAPTSMTRWEVAGGYALVRGRVEISPQIGFGRRTFSISSDDPSRSPDGDYQYMILGATAVTAVSPRVAVRGTFVYEPVVGGTEPTEMAFGEASRWALDVGAAVEVRPVSHMIVRASADYQRFAWAWDGAGARGAGGAVDGYPSGMLSVGAVY